MLIKISKEHHENEENERLAKEPLAVAIPANVWQDQSLVTRWQGYFVMKPTEVLPEMCLYYL